MMKLGELLTVVTPSWRTSSGRRGSAWLTRFCTCTCARSTSVPTRKVTVSVSTPSEVRLRRHVEHVLDAIDLLLQRGGDGLGEHPRVGAGIDGPDHDRRRHYLGILADRQREHRDAGRRERSRSRARPRKSAGR